MQNHYLWRNPLRSSSRSLLELPLCLLLNCTSGSAGALRFSTSAQNLVSCSTVAVGINASTFEGVIILSSESSHSTAGSISVKIGVIFERGIYEFRRRLPLAAGYIGSSSDPPFDGSFPDGDPLTSATLDSGSESPLSSLDI